MQAAQLDAVTTPQEELLWQTFFTRLLIGPKDESALTSLLKVLAQPQLQNFALAVAFYLKEHFDTTSAPIADQGQLVKRSKLAQNFLQRMKRMP